MEVVASMQKCDTYVAVCSPLLASTLVYFPFVQRHTTDAAALRELSDFVGP